MTNPGTWRYTGPVLWVSGAFLVLFTGYNSAQCLQSSLNQTLGNINLGVMYLAAAASAQVMPAVLERLLSGKLRIPIFGWTTLRVPADQRIGFLLTGAVYILGGVAVNLFRANSVKCDGSWALYIASFFLVGVGNSFMWPAQQDLVCRCALYRAFAETREEAEACTKKARQQEVKVGTRSNVLNVVQGDFSFAVTMANEVVKSKNEKATSRGGAAGATSASPATRRYCFGTAPPALSPWPAATTRPKAPAVVFFIRDPSFHST